MALRSPTEALTARGLLGCDHPAATEPAAGRVEAADIRPRWDGEMARLVEAIDHLDRRLDRRLRQRDVLCYRPSRRRQCREVGIAA
jgi:hypothetical protein